MKYFPYSYSVFIWIQSSKRCRLTIRITKPNCGRIFPNAYIYRPIYIPMFCSNIPIVYIYMNVWFVNLFCFMVTFLDTKICETNLAAVCYRFKALCLCVSGEIYDDDVLLPINCVFCVSSLTGVLHRWSPAVSTQNEIRSAAPIYIQLLIKPSITGPQRLQLLN